MRDINLDNIAPRVIYSFQKDADFCALYHKMNGQAQDTAKKVGIFGSKVFIAISEDGLFVQLQELNFIERFFRWLGFMPETEFSKEQLQRVKKIFDNSYVAATLDAEERQAVNNKIMHASGSLELDGLLREIEKKTKDPYRSQHKWRELLDAARCARQALLEGQKVVEVIDRVKDGVNGDFLDRVLEVIKKYPGSKAQQAKAVKELLAEFRTHSDISEDKLRGMYIFIDLLEIDLEEARRPPKLEDLGVPVPEEIEERVKKKLTEFKKDLRTLYGESPKSWKEHLERYTGLVAINFELDEFRASIRDEVVELMKEPVRQKMIESGIHHSLVDEWLNHSERGKTRVEQNTNLFLKEHDFAAFPRLLAQKTHKRQNKMMMKMMQELEPKENPGAGDCFFYSCGDHAPQYDVSEWRKQIVERMRQPEYLPLIEERLKTDEMARRAYYEEGDVPHEQYCNMMTKAGKWASTPELKAFSDIVERPVIVVHPVGEELHWSAYFNLEFQGDPLIFLNYNETHFKAMVPKTKL